MLSSLIIILREILEAAIIISVLLASLQMTRIKNTWLFWGMLFGLIGAFLMVEQFSVISNSFEGAGQELTNAGMLFTMSMLLLSYIFMLVRFDNSIYDLEPFIKGVLISIVALAVIREGDDILIYMSGYGSHIDSLPFIIGSSIGAWIGFSSGIIIYYTLLQCSAQLRLKSVIVITALLSAGMMSDGMLFLIQADWINTGKPIWNTSLYISESSFIGQLLYAIFAYEATPAKIQVVAYLLTLLAIIVLVVYAILLNKKTSNVGQHQPNKQP